VKERQRKGARKGTADYDGAGSHPTFPDLSKELLEQVSASDTESDPIKETQQSSSSDYSDPPDPNPDHNKGTTNYLTEQAANDTNADFMRIQSQETHSPTPSSYPNPLTATPTPNTPATSSTPATSVPAKRPLHSGLTPPGPSSDKTTPPPKKGKKIVKTPRRPFKPKGKKYTQKQHKTGSSPVKNYTPIINFLRKNRADNDDRTENND